MTLLETITRWLSDSDKAHNIIHGDANTTVTTEGGPVRSLAKLISDSAAYIAEIAGFKYEAADYTAFRAYSGVLKSVLVLAPGVGGQFVRDTTDTTSADNGGTIIVDALGRRWKRRHSGPVAVSFFGGAIDDGVTDASAAAQTLAALCDAGKKRHIYIPSWGGILKWASTVSITNPGVRIFGDQSATYNRGGGKEGWLNGQSGLVRFFDLGASRTTGNPADQWQVEGISMKQDTGVTVRTIDGISFTSRTNGPDRGATIRDVSFIGLKDAVTIENPDVSVSLASLNIEGCVFQGCRSAINSKGNLLGLRFVGNQCEQNIGNGTTGVIGGAINSGVTITDNMLEGQPNSVSIDVPPMTGGRPSLLMARNYIEGNTGYLLRYRCSSTGANLEMGPNFISGSLPGLVDYLLFEGGSGGVTLTNNDPYPFTLKNTDVRIQFGSKPFNFRVRGYEVRQLLPTTYIPEVVLSDFANLTDDVGAWTHVLPAAGNTGMTPFGVKNITPGGTDLSATVAVAAGDLVCVNILMRVKEVAAGGFAIYVRNESSVFLRGGGAATILPTDLKGRWALVSLPFIALASATSVRTRLVTTSGTYPSAIAGVTVRNYGAFTNDGTSKVLIEPVVPNI